MGSSTYASPTKWCMLSHVVYTGTTLEEEDITRMEIVKYPDSPLSYYIYDLKPHYLISATAYRNRLFVQTIRASSVQWRKAGAKLQVSRDSFRVQTA